MIQKSAEGVIPTKLQTTEPRNSKINHHDKSTGVASAEKSIQKPETASQGTVFPWMSGQTVLEDGRKLTVFPGCNHPQSWESCRNLLRLLMLKTSEKSLPLKQTLKNLKLLYSL